MQLPAAETLTVLREPTRFVLSGCAGPEFLTNHRHYNVFHAAILLKRLRREIYRVFSELVQRFSTFRS
jgi:hypothetical protein